MKLLFFILLLMASLASAAKTDTALVAFKNPGAVSLPKGYSHSAIIDLGNCRMVIISGQVALDKNGSLVGEGDLAKQTEQVFLNLKAIMEDAGGSLDNLVKIGIYLTDLAELQTLRKIRDKYINPAKPPTSTLVQVASLFRSDLLVEIEATAIIPDPGK